MNISMCSITLKPPLPRVCLRLSPELPHLAVLQQRASTEQLLRLVSPQPFPPAGAVSPAHGRHQQPGALPLLRHRRPVLFALPGYEREHAVPAGVAALPVLLSDPVAGPAGVEQSAPAGSAGRPPGEPQQQDHQHREPPSEGQAARSIAGIGHTAQLKRGPPSERAHPPVRASCRRQAAAKLWFSLLTTDLTRPLAPNTQTVPPLACGK